TVFLLFGGSAGGAVWEHVGRDSNTGWSKIWGSGVTEISAGFASSGAPPVFFTTGGAVGDDRGTDSIASWLRSGTTAIPHITACPPISAARSADPTGYVLFGGSTGGAVWEHVGTDSNAGWFKIWASGVTEISAGLTEA